jgi:hypothetical protein
LTNKLPSPMDTGSRPDSFMGGTAVEFMGVLTWGYQYR